MSNHAAKVHGRVSSSRVSKSSSMKTARLRPSSSGNPSRRRRKRRSTAALHVSTVDNEAGNEADDEADNEDRPMTKLQSGKEDKQKVDMNPDDDESIIDSDVEVEEEFPIDFDSDGESDPEDEDRGRLLNNSEEVIPAVNDIIKEGEPQETHLSDEQSIPKANDETPASLNLNFNPGISLRSQPEKSIDEDVPKQLKFTSAQKEEILSKLGEKPDLPASIRENQEVLASLQQYATDIKHLVQNVADLVFSADPTSNIISPDRLPWLTDNCTADGQSLLVDLFTDPRVVPYVVQCAYGQRNWGDDMLAHLKKYDNNNLHELPDAWGVYGISVKLRPDNADPVNVGYVGSSTAGYVKGRVGIASRLISGHRPLFAKSLRDIRKERGEGKTHALFIHELGTRPGASHTYHVKATFPALSGQGILQDQSKQLILFLETIFIVYEDAISTSPKRVSRLRTIGGKVVKRIRPKHLPIPSSLGANGALPISQGGKTNQNISLFHELLRRLAAGYYRSNKTPYLTSSGVETIRERAKLSKYAPSEITNGQILAAFRTVLEWKGIKYVKRTERKLQLLMPVVIAAKEFLAQSEDFHLNLHTNTYEYQGSEMTRSQKKRIAKVAQTLAPEPDKKLYTFKHYYKKWNEAFTLYGAYLLYKPNWDRISDKVPLTIHMIQPKRVTLKKRVHKWIVDVIGVELYKYAKRHVLEARITGDATVNVAEIVKAGKDEVISETISHLKKNRNRPELQAYSIRSDSTLTKVLRPKLYENFKKRDIALGTWRSYALPVSWPRDEMPRTSQSRTRVSAEELVDISVSLTANSNVTIVEDQIPQTAWTQLKAAENKIPELDHFAFTNACPYGSMEPINQPSEAYAVETLPSTSDSYMLELLEPLPGPAEGYFSSRRLPGSTQGNSENAPTEPINPSIFKAEIKLWSDESRKRLRKICPANIFASELRNEFKKIVDDIPSAGHALHRLKPEEYIHTLQKVIDGVSQNISQIDLGPEQNISRQNIIRRAVNWMFKDWNGEGLYPKPSFLKDRLKIIWQTTGLDLLFLLHPPKYLRYSKSTSDFWGDFITGTNMRRKFFNEFDEFDKEKRKGERSALLAVLIPEVYQEVEDDPQSIAKNVIQFVKDIGKELIAENSEVLEVPKFGQYHTSARGKGKSRMLFLELADELKDRVVERANDPLIIGDCDFVIPLICQQALRLSGSEMLADCFLEVLSEYYQNSEHELKSLLEEDYTEFFLLPGALQFRRAVELKCRERYGFEGERLPWSWNPDQLWPVACEPICKQIAREYGVQVDETDKATLPLSVTLGPSTFRFTAQQHKDMHDESVWTKEEANYVWSLLESVPQLSHREVSRWTDGRLYNSVIGLEQYARQVQGLLADRPSRGGIRKGNLTPERKGLLLKLLADEKDERTYEQWAEIYFPDVSGRVVESWIYRDLKITGKRGSYNIPGRDGSKEAVEGPQDGGEESNETVEEPVKKSAKRKSSKSHTSATPKKAKTNKN